MDRAIRERLDGMLLGAFAADAFALGPHWIYDPRLIEKLYGRPVELTYPQPDSLHFTKKLGDFTHYGDQMLLLLSSLHKNRGFLPDVFAREWHVFMDSYAGYRDKAMKVTYENLRQGKQWQDASSLSNDFSAVGRIAPILYHYGGKFWEAVPKAIQLVFMTHNNLEVIYAVKFFAEIVYLILDGMSPSYAITKIWSEMVDSNPLKNLVKAGMDQKDQPSCRVIQQFGAQCSLRNALPSTIQMILRCEEDYMEALIENVVAGGDSAGRGIVLGMILGAWNGPKAIPETWLKRLIAYHRILELMSAIERSSS
ncbi:MAG: ADP-ribosylglycohydrolase family protein [Marinifilaceae bacterium]